MDRYPLSMRSGYPVRGEAWSVANPSQRAGHSTPMSSKASQCASDGRSVLEMDPEYVPRPRLRVMLG